MHVAEAFASYIIETSSSLSSAPDCVYILTPDVLKDGSTTIFESAVATVIDGGSKITFDFNEPTRIEEVTIITAERDVNAKITTETPDEENKEFEVCVKYQELISRTSHMVPIWTTYENA